MSVQYISVSINASDIDTSDMAAILADKLWNTDAEELANAVFSATDDEKEDELRVFAAHILERCDNG